MNIARFITTAIIICIVSTAVLGQGTGAARQKSRTAVRQDSLRDGLKLIYSGRDRDWEKDLDIDMEKLSATIEASVDRAMQSLDVSLRHMDADFNIPEIEIPEIDIPEIHIPDIEVPEINIHIPDIDVDVSHDRFEREDEDDEINRDADKVKEKVKEKSKENKKKGLVKIR